LKRLKKLKKVLNKSKDNKMTTVKCSATTKKGTKCNYKAKYGAFCGHHCLKDQVTPVVKKAKVAKPPKVSLPRLSAAKAN